MEDINSELDELDREEFYRLKKVGTRFPTYRGWSNPRKVKNNKQRDNDAAEKSHDSKRSNSDKENESHEDPVDVLGEREDQDVIF